MPTKDRRWNGSAQQVVVPDGDREMERQSRGGREKNEEERGGRGYDEMRSLGKFGPQCEEPEQRSRMLDALVW